jgi:hypothetical protein
VRLIKEKIVIDLIFALMVGISVRFMNEVFERIPCQPISMHHHQQATPKLSIKTFLCV